MSDTRPNILFITCDQLRFDGLGVFGNSVVSTPALDQLAREGVRLEHFFSQSTVCQPSRATLATGRYPHIHGVKYNGYDLASSETTLQKVLSANGYSTVSIGKMHFDPVTELHGFQSRVFIEGKMYVGDDEYRVFLDERGKRRLFEEHVAAWDAVDFGARRSPLPDDEYIDSYIGQRAIETLRDMPEPFFAWVSFVNPHMPFDPPSPFAEMYDPNSIPLPPDWADQRQDSRIPEHRTSSAGRDFATLDGDRVRQIRALYYGAISLVDREIGRILTALRDKDTLDRTLVVFTSDHGEFLGNRGLLWKGGRMLYDDLLRVPFIARWPEQLPSNVVVSHLAQATDVMPTFLDFAGVETPLGVQGRSLRPILSLKSVPNWRDVVFSEGLAVKMVRDYHWKLIFYPEKTYGELYDLQNDPGERNNLYYSSTHATQRHAMTERLAAVLALSEDPLPAANPRLGYFVPTRFHPEQELSG